MENQFTYSYSQPDNYHFCQDSILFPHFVAQNIREKVNAQTRVLDVCAGCGVIGFELQYHLPILRGIEFLEIQERFQPHFEDNRRLTGRDDFKFLHMNYGRLKDDEYGERYDFILGNPPYFHSGDGKLPRDDLKYRARFFADDSFENLIDGVLNALKSGGEAYLLVKPGLKHGRDSLQKIRLRAQGRANAEAVADIRGTSAVRIKKN